jgi:hypothetical protein
MHMPERWGYLQFSASKPDAKLPAFELPYSELQSQYLWLIFYRQQEYFRKNGSYASSLDELHLPSVVSIADKSNTLSMDATPLQFTACVSDASGKVIRINNEGARSIK